MKVTGVFERQLKRLKIFSLLAGRGWIAADAVGNLSFLTLTATTASIEKIKRQNTIETFRMNSPHLEHVDRR